MAEFTGLGYYAEVPAVIFDVQRVGPSTGLPTRTAQQDVLSTATLSHGDTKHPLLIPASVAECYTMAMDAFDLAERSSRAATPAEQLPRFRSSSARLASHRCSPATGRASSDWW
jgi:pyruvate/2-oxoacid:ferredoxin oxidoreductase alpha subunit